MPLPKLHIALPLLFSVLVATACAQSSAPPFPVPLDPSRALLDAPLSPHRPLPEQYIWTAGEVTALRPDHGKFPWSRTELRTEPRFFRARFRVDTVPAQATLYIAGPREAHVFLNGKLLGDFYLNTDAPINFRVFHADASAALRQGENVLAIQAIRGRGVVSGASPLATQQLAYGEVLAAKLLPARFGVQAPALVFSSRDWRSSGVTSNGWQDPTFDDTAWPFVESLGPVESNVGFLQWSTDAGMYGWPGYLGMSPALRTYTLPAVAVSHIFAAGARFDNLASLTAASPVAPFSVSNARAQQTDAESPSLLLDFGREISGRLLVESSSPTEALLSVAYGESELEALATGLTPEQRGGNYLGTNLLDIPANGVARGPKSGFRYVRIRFLRGARVSSFKSIRAEGIYYPVNYVGSFDSSDPLLNRIWETGAYTAHLCMQDGIWDAVKRDRGRWVGDLAVEGRVISTAFGDSRLIEQTLQALVPPHGHVNGIPGYSALWVTSLYNLYSRSGDRDFVAAQRDALLQILSTMDASLGLDGLFDNSRHQWLFVDWAPGLWGYTTDAMIGTNLQYVTAYAQAGSLLRMLGDHANAAKYERQSASLLAASQKRFRDAGAPTYGSTWQLNTLALLAPHASDADRSAIWSQVLSRVKQDSPTDQVISPYFNASVLDAMAAAGHARQALDWMRAYWGGMLAEGATSFWESYDLRWSKTDPHLSLQADGTSGFFVSLAHGWSSGPTAWLSENVLGVRDPRDGYRTVTIAPHLGGLAWAHGSVPTAHGPIAVSIDKEKGLILDLPEGIAEATVLLPLEEVGRPGQHVYLNGQPAHSQSVEAGFQVKLSRAGHYVFELR